MVTQKAQIQALINQINEALSKNSPRLPWVMSSDAVQQRQVLEQTRQYLLSLQQQLEEGSLVAAASNLSSGQTGQAMQSGQAVQTEQSMQAPAESAQQVLQAVLQEMNYWRVNMLQPLRTEIDMLQQQRQVLLQELRQLEAQRQQYGLPQNQQMLMEFLQSAMTQMQASLSAQVTQMIAAQSTAQLSAQVAALNPAERLAQIEQMQFQSDQLMLKLDSTLQVIFDSLNRNVQAYQESLEQGLNRMHGLGQQGEAMFAFLVNRLAQQIGREASSFLQSSSERQQPGTTKPAEDSAFTVADFLSQPEASPETFRPSEPFNLSEEVLDIAELEGSMPLNQQVEKQSDNSLEALNLELSQLDLTAFAANVEAESESATSLELFAGDQALIDEVPPPPSVSASAPAVITDLDSALDLLNQLSAEMQTSTADLVPDFAAEASPNFPDAPKPDAAELVPAPDSLYDDSFYSDLQEPNQAAASAASIDPFSLDQEWFGGLGDPAAESMATSSSSGEPAPVDRDASSSDLFSDLFADLSDVDSKAEPSLPSQPITEPLSEPPNANPAAVPNLEESLPVAEASTKALDWGIDTLGHLGDPAPSAQSEPPLTIEGLEGLFADLPDLSAAPTADSAAPTQSESASESIPEAAPSDNLVDWFAQFQESQPTELLPQDSSEKKKS